MDLKLIEYNSSGSVQGPVAGSCEHGNELSNSIKHRAFLDRGATVSFSRRTQLPGVNTFFRLITILS
jgi:hypothetical protein